MDKYQKQSTEQMEYQQFYNKMMDMGILLKIYIFEMSQNTNKITLPVPH